MIPFRWPYDDTQTTTRIPHNGNERQRETGRHFNSKKPKYFVVFFLIHTSFDLADDFSRLVRCYVKVYPRSGAIVKPLPDCQFYQTTGNIFTYKKRTVID